MVLSPLAILKQTIGWIWPTGFSLPAPAMCVWEYCKIGLKSWVEEGLECQDEVLGVGLVRPWLQIPHLLPWGEELATNPQSTSPYNPTQLHQTARKMCV